jgi:hypothetical protein
LAGFSGSFPSASGFPYWSSDASPASPWRLAYPDLLLPFLPWLVLCRTRQHHFRIYGQLLMVLFLLYDSDKSYVNAGMPEKVSPASEFLPVVRCLSPPSAFRLQGSVRYRWSRISPTLPNYAFVYCTYKAIIQIRTTNHCVRFPICFHRSSLVWLLISQPLFYSIPQLRRSPYF